MRLQVQKQLPTISWITIAVVAISALIGAGVALGADTILPAATSVASGLLPLVVVLGALAALHARTRLWALSPVALLVFAYLAVALLGPLSAAASSVGLGASARISLSDEETFGTYLIFLLAAGAVVAGALVVAVRKPMPVPAASGKVGSVRWRRLAAIFAMFPAILTILLYREALLVRPVYLVGELGSPLSIAAQVLPIPAVVALGWVAKVGRTGRERLLSWLGISVYVVLLFSMATRALSLVPLLVVLGMLAADASSRRLQIWALLAAIASIVLLQTPLALRGSFEHGLIPYLNGWFALQSSGPGLSGAISNILFSYALTGAVAYHASALDWSWFLISIDPRPGQLTDWYTIEPLLRINAYTPDNAMGELANYGLGVLAVCFLVVGALFAYLDRRIRQLLSEGFALGGLLLFALSAFFVLETLQYNLRSASRVIYYLIAADIGLRIIGRIWHPETRA